MYEWHKGEVSEGKLGKGKGGVRLGKGRGTRQQLTHAGELVTHKSSADTILHFD